MPSILSKPFRRREEKEQDTSTHEFQATIDSEEENDVLDEDDVSYEEMLLIEQNAKFFFKFCDFLRFGTVASYFKSFKENDRPISSYSKGMMKALFKELIRVNENAGHFCVLCDRFMFTPRQTFMHIGSEGHINQTRKQSVELAIANNILIEMIGKQRIEKMFEQEHKQFMSHLDYGFSLIRLGASVDKFLPGPNLLWLPLQEILEKPIEVKAGCILSVMRKEAGLTSMIVLATCVENTSVQLGCFSCKLLFADYKAFYTHHLTFWHIKNACAFDLITMAVNLYRPRGGEELPWPKMDDE